MMMWQAHCRHSDRPRAEEQRAQHARGRARAAREDDVDPHARGQLAVDDLDRSKARRNNVPWFVGSVQANERRLPRTTNAKHARNALKRPGSAGGRPPPLASIAARPGASASGAPGGGRSCSYPGLSRANTPHTHTQHSVTFTPPARTSYPFVPFGLVSGPTEKDRRGFHFVLRLIQSKLKTRRR